MTSASTYSRLRRELPDFSVLEAEVGADREILRDGPVRAERIVDDWVNGVVFHSDNEKRDRVLFAGAPEMYLFVLFAAVQEFAKVYVVFARMAKAILAEPGCSHCRTDLELPRTELASTASRLRAPFR